MTTNLQVTIDLSDPNLDEQELETETQKLLAQMKNLEQNDELNRVDRVSDPNPPVGGKGAGFLVGLLMAEVSKENLKKLWGFLGDRLGNKPIKLKIKAPDGQELEIEASSQQEFEFAYQKAQAFLQG